MGKNCCLLINHEKVYVANIIAYAKCHEYIIIAVINTARATATTTITKQRKQ